MTQNDISKLRIDRSPGGTGAPHNRRGHRWRRYGIIAAGIIVLYVFYASCLNPVVQVQAVSVSRMYPSQSFTVLNASGYVVAQRKAAVASKVTGRLIALNVQEGNSVQKGDVLAELESDDVSAARSQATANLEQARAEMVNARSSYDREKNLLGSGITTKSDFDVAETRYKKSRAAVAAAEAAVRSAVIALEYTLIRAPFDAVVLTKNADIGDIVTPLGAAANAKAAVVTIADMNSLQVEVDVSESSIELVRVGQPCEILLDAISNARFRGAVNTVVPTADRSKGTVMVKVRFEETDTRVLPEMSAKVAFLQRPLASGEERSILAVPAASIAEHDNGTTSGAADKSVFVILNGRANKSRVVTGRSFGDMVEILQGVNAGDRIVARLPKNIKNGRRLEVTE